MPSTTAMPHHAHHASGRHPRHAAHAFPYHEQPQQLHPLQLAPQDADVLARAQAIAQAQAQIQAQMAAFAQQQQRSAVYHGPTARQPTLHHLHQRSASTAAALPTSALLPQSAVKQKKMKSRSNSSSSTSSSTSSTASNAGAGTASMSRVEWRVAVDPKSKRPYYYHPVTRETTWKKPASLAELEAREKRQFFFAMENNIRSKLQTGTWLRRDRDSDSSSLDALPFRHSDIGMATLAHAPPPDPHMIRSSLGSNADVERRLQLGPFVTRSAPNTPDFGAVTIPVLKRADASTITSPQQQSVDSTDDEDDDEQDELATAAAAKPPLLFRTLSSYETPVVMEKKADSDATGGSNGVRLVTIPSPIQERVRLATGLLLPRASDLESYTQSGSRDLATAPRSIDARQPLRRRSNSTSTIYVRMGTINAPDQDCMITCVATVLRAHMVEAAAAPIAIDAKFDVFIGRREREQRAAADNAADSLSFGRLPHTRATAAATTPVVIVPPLKEIGAFIKHVFSRAQMESECIIMSLVYVERLLKATSGALQLRGSNWRAILFCSMVMASKVWDDLSMCNADFSKIWPELSLKEINELELAYLSAVEYNVRVSAVSYAKYYFHLRSMCASMGLLAAFDECAPLNLDGARKMQVLSEELQERSKLLPAPRRRSVTITATSVASASRASASNKASKPSPSASLEELVAMQVRGAGGRSLASMHRLSSQH